MAVTQFMALLEQMEIDKNFEGNSKKKEISMKYTIL